HDANHDEVAHPCDMGHDCATARYIAALDPATVRELVWAARERQWIPVSESHPATARVVLVNSDGYVWLGYFTGDLWLRLPGHSILNNVTHWMPLPEVPHD